jgi:hypothetical protein
MALLGNYMAAAFATSGAGDVGILAVNSMAGISEQVSLVSRSTQPGHFPS